MNIYIKKIFRKKSKGMSLIELIVAIGIIAIVSAGMSAFFSYVWKSRFREMNIGQSSLLASRAVTEISENIRRSAQANSGAYLIDSADDFEIIFYSDSDGDGDRERIHYYLDGNSLKEASAEPILGTNPTYPEEDEVEVILNNNIANEASEPIFKYYDYSGSLLSAPVSPSAVRLVRITVSVNTDPSNIEDVVIESAAAIRNLNN